MSQASRAPYLLFLLREDVAPAEWVRQGKLREAAQAEANAETDLRPPAPAPQIPAIWDAKEGDCVFLLRWAISLAQSPRPRKSRVG